MHDKIIHYLRMMRQRISAPKMFLFLGIIVLMGNLDALIDKVLHPEISYLDNEHLIIGVIYTFLTVFIFAMLMISTANVRRTEEKLRSLFDASTDFIYLLDKQGVILQTNQAMLDRSGYSKRELVGRGIYEFFTPASQKIFEERFPVLLKQGKNRAEVEFVYKNGAIVTMDCSGSAVYDEQGEIASFIIVERDITERKRAEEYVRAVSSRQEAILSAVPDIIMEVDNNKVYTWANQAGYEFFGEDVIGKEAAFYFEGEQDTYMAVEPLFKGSEDVFYVESWQRRKDGKKRLLAWWCRVLKDKNGNVTGALSSGRDITERKQEENALQESEKRYKKLVESVTDYMYTVQVENGRAKETKHGPGCIAVTGYTSEEYESDPYLWYRMIHEEDRRAVMEQAGKILSGAASSSLEHRIVHKDCSVRWVKNSPVPRCDESGRLIGYDGMVSDITERKRLENQLHQAQKMEAVGQLAGGIAHDFNNILSAILGYGSLLQMKIDKDDPLRAYVDQIIASSHRAAHLTHSILAFSRKQIINPKPIDLNEVIGRVEKLLLRLIGEDIELKTILTPPELPVMADSGQIEQVLINLCTNARDAMPHGGFLLIETRVIECDEQFVKAHPYGKPGTYALFSVSDTGIGMDDKMKEKIFEPFFTTKETGKGTGLGLSIVYGIVKQHGGYINVYSELGKGSTFKIYLPILTSAIKKSESAPSIPAARGTETVLMAEDDAAVRTIAREVFEQFGYTVIEARDGEDAVNKFREHRDSIALLVLDVLMPKKNGKDAYEEIKKIRPGVKVIFTSGYTADILHKKGILEEGTTFLSKPISTNEFIRMVRTVLDTEIGKL
jgi:PAS domain S-box-containing protein